MRLKAQTQPSPRAIPLPWQRGLLLVLVFVGGLSSLGLEFAAARLLAPYFGQSLFIWGTLIGLILIYLTVGYYVGGRVADRHPRGLLLYQITAVAAVAMAVIPIVSRPILSIAQTGFAQFSVGLVVGSLLSVIVLFALPVILLGMVSPYVIRLRIEDIRTAGNAAGAVYALSTLGSILGTFLPVFWMIPTFGTRVTINILAVLLGIVSALGLWQAGRRRLFLLVPVALAALLLFQQGSIRGAAYGQRLYEAESAYNYIQVVQDGTRTDLVLNEGHAVHSIYDPTTLYTHGPWDYFLLAPLFGGRTEPGRLAIIGLAGGTVARQYTSIFGAIPIDGVEIDPKIVDIGRRYFDMNAPNLRVAVADGRYWLARQDQRYDVIAVDAYRQPYIPFYLTTREFFATAREHLTPDGVLAINAGRTERDFRLVDALSGTLTAVYPSVFVVDVRDFTNSLVFAIQTKTSVDEFRAHALQSENLKLQPVVREALASGNLREVHPNGIVFTDDLAPVERLIDQIILGYIRGGS